MSARGDWIDFATLVERSQFKERTLRRMIAGKQISSRQRVRGGKREFNWHTVERELALLDDRSNQADRAAASMPQDVQAQLAGLRAIIEKMAAKLGVAA